MPSREAVAEGKMGKAFPLDKIRQIAIEKK